MTPRRNPYGLTLCPNGHLPRGSNDHGDVAGSLPDPGRSPQRPGAEPTKRRSFVHEFRNGLRFHLLLAYFSDVLRSVWWPWVRKIRVGANSPSLWPTIDSVMKIGTCLRPS